MKPVFIVLSSVAFMVAASRAADPPATKPSPAVPTQAEAAKPFTNIDVAQFEKMRTNKDTVVLDVRTKREFDKGHVPGAVNLDVNAAEFKEKAAQLDTTKTYLVFCGAGVRSVKACNTLAPLKFDKLFNLEGGYNAWEKAGNKGTP